ncbi:MAG: hypothetical protein AABZ54_00295 [Bacteroidota bacterium]
MKKIEPGKTMVTINAHYEAFENNVSKSWIVARSNGSVENKILTGIEQGTQAVKAPLTEMSAEHRLKRMKELFDQKIITEEEYASNRKTILTSLSDTNNKGIKETNTENSKNETPKVNEDENKSTSNKVEETKNTNQDSVAVNDGLFKVDNVEGRMTDKQNPILTEWDKWVNRPKFQALTSGLKSSVIEEYVKSRYSSSSTYKEKMDSLISMLKNYEGVDTAIIKKP